MSQGIFSIEQLKGIITTLRSKGSRIFLNNSSTELCNNLPKKQTTYIIGEYHNPLHEYMHVVKQTRLMAMPDMEFYYFAVQYHRMLCGMDCGFTIE
ncbi:MAG: hypothetical protein IJV22_08010 [Bacteroidales bacterium]|nr:hypothetical protein [Bacteroidales bacterium]